MPLSHIGTTLEEIRQILRDTTHTLDDLSITVDTADERPVD